VNRKIFVGLTIVSAFIAGVGKVLGKSYELGFCYSDTVTRTFDVSCHRLFERLSDSFLFGGISFAIVFVALVFKPKAFSAWKKFAIWATPIMVLIFATHNPSGGFMTVSPDSETLFKWIAGLYTVISLIIIGRVALKKK
jgi:hypothetical protein